MAWFEIGAGPDLNLSSWYRWDHLLYRTMGELFASKNIDVSSTIELFTDRVIRKLLELIAVRTQWILIQFTQDLDVLRDHLGLDQMALLGHSWGSGLGLLYAQAYPETLVPSHLGGSGTTQYRNEGMLSCE